MSRKKTFDEFLKEALIKHPNSKYQYDESTYIDTHTPMKIICPKHGEFWVSPKSHLLYECKKCSYEKRAKKYMLTTEDFIKKAKFIHGNDRFNYDKVKYNGTKIKVCIICPKHGEFWQTPNVHLSGRGCPKCKDSQLEKITERFLKENNIKYLHQYKPIWLGKQSLDFYLPEYNIAIECQGKQHFGVGGWVDDFDFHKLYENDKKKYYLCEENKIDLYYFINEKDKTYINNNIIYKDKIYTNLKDLISCIHKKK